MDAKRLAEALKNLDAQSFRQGDSLLASTINHPIDAVGQLGNWVAQRTNTAAGIPEQYDNPNPLLAPQGQEQAAFDLAGMAQLGSMPFAPKSAGGTLGTFIGPKAATWDTDKAAAAAKMLDDGVDPAQVWQQHMIGRMPDGKLFSEIDDSQSFMKPSNEWGWGNREGFKQGERAIGSLDEFMSHQGIADNYPGFFDFGDDGRRMVMTIDKNAGNGGSFGDSSIRLGSIDNTDGSSIANKSTALHELQHAIQQREGWARGGSPEGMNDIWTAARARLNFLEKEPDYLQATKLDDDLFNKAAFGELPYDQYEQASKNLLNDFPAYAEAQKQLEVLRKIPQDSHEAYRRLTGEAQARATQDRLNMSLDERRNNYPLAGGKLSDIPLEQLIYRYGDNGPAMSVDDNLNSSLLAKYLREGQLSPQELAQYETNAVQMTDSGKHHYNLANANAQGGTPESRAVDLGFDTPAYHGTNADIKEFDYKYTGNGNDQFGSGFYTDTRPYLASGYANGEGAAVYPLMVNIKKPLDSEFEKTLTKKQITDIIKGSPNIDDALSSYGDIDYEGKAKVLREAVNSNYDYQDDTLLKNLHPLNNDFYSGEPEKFSQAVNKATGYDSVKVNFDDGQHLIPWFPNQIRSRFAAFDPLRKDSANLLASYLLPATMLGFGMAPQDDRQSLIEALRNGN